MRSWPEIYLPPAPDWVVHKPLSLFNSYTRVTKEINEHDVSSYVCGITPYDATHLGHAATYISFDLIHRYLLASGKNVSFVENITDIDDPLLERATRDNQDWRDLAFSQIDLFRTDMTTLRVIPPTDYQGVVESMSIIINSIQEYIAAGLTYKIDNDIYLDLNKVPGYPENLPMSFDEAIKIFAERGGDPQRAGKINQLDPLLWRGQREGEPTWEAAFGAGRPGWHVECVAIASRFLPSSAQSTITIQGGGSDLIFPHHYMTAMQSKALTHQEFATHYVHAGMIGLDGDKMSKSKGNLVFVSKLLESGVKPQAIRLALLSDHYQADRMWNVELLKKAEELLAKLELALAKTEVAPTLPAVSKMVDALANNLDTPTVLDLLNKWCDETNSGSMGGSAGEMSRAIDTYLGIAL
jgi:L-cysteine:1D-myo-inositol 2-amino-2-deoxy-alpha-D-glucopyranoside ligase